MITTITIFTLIFFNIAFFLLGGSSTGSTAVWIAYAFIHFAGLCQFVTPLIFSKKNATAVSIGMSLRLFSLVHFIAILIAGITIILISPDGWKASFLVLLFITLVYMALLLAMQYSNHKITTVP